MGGLVTAKGDETLVLVVTPFKYCKLEIPSGRNQMGSNHTQIRVEHQNSM